MTYDILVLEAYSLTLSYDRSRYLPEADNDTGSSSEVFKHQTELVIDNFPERIPFYTMQIIKSNMFGIVHDSWTPRQPSSKC